MANLASIFGKISTQTKFLGIIPVQKIYSSSSFHLIRLDEFLHLSPISPPSVFDIPQIRMFSLLVYPNVVLPGGTIIAEPTRKLFLPSVLDQDVVVKDGAGLECLGTECAQERARCGVNCLLVRVEVAPIAESFAADCARVRGLVPLVHAHLVGVAPALAGECFVAKATLEVLLSGVVFDVDIERDFLNESSATDCACVRPLAGVDGIMAF